MRSSEPVVHLVETPTGTARLTVHLPAPDAGRGGSAGARVPVGTLALGHGAGGGIEAVDLQAVTAAVVRIGWRVVLVEQPWRVAGRKVAVAPPKLDQGWTAALTAQSIVDAAPGPLVLGGRSAGARVACRTAGVLGAAGVVCLAFPLHPPGRPAASRIEELLGAGVPCLVVQGRRDAFGTPQEVSAAIEAGVPSTAAATGAGLEVVAVDGDHGLKADPATVATTVADWLRRQVPGRSPGRRAGR